MIRPDESELVVRAVALYLPIVAMLGAVAQRRPTRRTVAAAVLATAWNLAALLVLNVIAIRAGWWDFMPGASNVAGVPAELWIGWALLWGATPILATAHRFGLVAATLVLVDLVLMPVGEPVIHLHRTWILGEGLAIGACLVPGLVLARLTIDNRRIQARAALQIGAFGALLLFVLPSLIFEVTSDSWAPLLERPRWHLVAAALVAAPIAAMAVQAVREFASSGGTPLPLDPPPALVTTGPYAYVANPMQLAGTLLLSGLGVLLTSPAVIAAAAMGAVFSAGLAAWAEHQDLGQRFGGDWERYRRRTRLWVPHWRPATDTAATVYVARSCDACSTVGRFLARRQPTGLVIAAAETSGRPMQRLTYQAGTTVETGIGALVRSLEHANLAWASASWIARLPLIRPALQLITDAVGGHPRAIESAP